jgi:hypothetical protein
MARHSAQLSRDEEQDKATEGLTRKREALVRLGTLRRDLQARIGMARDPISEARMIRERQRDEVVRPVRAR